MARSSTPWSKSEDPVADLGDGPPTPHPLILGKKEEMTDGEKASK